MLFELRVLLINEINLTTKIGVKNLMETAEVRYMPVQFGL